MTPAINFTMDFLVKVVNIAIVIMEAAKYIFHDLYTNERFKNNQKQKMINNCIV